MKLDYPTLYLFLWMWLATFVTIALLILPFFDFKRNKK